MQTLVIGAGERRVEGAVHHDIQDLPGIDIVCDFWDLLEHVKKSSCKEIHMTHVLEHFPMKDVQKVLLLVKSLLASTGRLYLEVPNFYWHALGMLANPRDRQMVEYAFGGQLNEYDFHFNGFTPEILHDDLTSAGFEVTELRPNSSIECWATK